MRQRRLFLRRAFNNHRGQRDIAYRRCKRHTSCCSGEKYRTIIPLEIQSFHLRTDKGHELAFPKNSDVHDLCVSARLQLCVFFFFREPWSKSPASASRSAVIGCMRPKLTCVTPALVLGCSTPRPPRRKHNPAQSSAPYPIWSLEHV